MQALEERKPKTEVHGYIDYRIGMAGDKLDGNHLFDTLSARVEVSHAWNPSTKITIAVRFLDELQESAVTGRYNQEGELWRNYPYGPWQASTGPDGYGEGLPWLEKAQVELFRGRSHWTIGRQFFCYGLGCMVNNERRGVQAIRWQRERIFGSSFDLDVIFGGASYDWMPVPPSSKGSDKYIASRLCYRKPHWWLAFNWLPDGVGKEEIYRGKV